MGDVTLKKSRSAIGW